MDTTSCPLLGPWCMEPEKNYESRRHALTNESVRPCAHRWRFRGTTRAAPRHPHITTSRTTAGAHAGRLSPSRPHSTAPKVKSNGRDQVQDTTSIVGPNSRGGQRGTVALRPTRPLNTAVPTQKANRSQRTKNAWQGPASERTSMRCSHKACRPLTVKPRGSSLPLLVASATRLHAIARHEIGTEQDHHGVIPAWAGAPAYGADPRHG